MELAVEIILAVITIAAGLFVLGLFVWAAVKDGQDNDAIQAKIQRRRWPQ